MVNGARILCSTPSHAKPYAGRVCAPSILLNTWQNLPAGIPFGMGRPPGGLPAPPRMSPSSPYALILDDHPLVAHGMAEFLRARMPQMDVVVASGADDLLRWVGTRGTPAIVLVDFCLLYTSPSPRDQRGSRMPSSA